MRAQIRKRSGNEAKESRPDAVCLIGQFKGALLSFHFFQCADVHPYFALSNSSEQLLRTHTLLQSHALIIIAMGRKCLGEKCGIFTHYPDSQVTLYRPHKYFIIDNA